ncbi:DUF3320 domain-containing protein [Paenibacillus sp. HJGM_3]|uniref:DUF3320 domain-containing protein n=1 Tax=Paenibacillus sp. HJGM_3 TaxID=3379816 RepID=UPI00385C9C74
MESIPDNKLACSWLRYDVINFAMQQNYVPVVSQIMLSNLANEDIGPVTVRIHAEPEFARDWSKTVDVLPAGQSVDLGVIDIQLSGTYLAGLTERLTGALTLEVTQADRVLYLETSPLTLLAYDQWGGLATMPEMVAAFVMPNHPAVAKVIGEAALLLEKWTGNSSFDAYQSQNPNRVRQQAAALFSAVQAYQSTYCVAPASFEEVGQRVRLPEAVFGNRMGNCLDLTLLYAACLEAVGLNPLILFTKGHAFPGVWLVQETFSESVQDDISLISKRLAAGVHEISIVESTWMCAGHHSLYQEAEAAARANLNDPDAFLGFVDVRRARASAIRPIPIRIATPDGWELIQEKQEGPIDAQAPEEIQVKERPAEVESIPVTKQKQWERKLLDLTLRNSLLNFRPTKAALPLLQARLSELEDALAEGREFQLLPKPSDWDNTPRSAELFRSAGQDHPLNALVQQEFLQRRLRTEANERELADKSIHLYRSARLALEENGANTLYLALGLLRWYESPASELARYAPVVLVPVELIRRSSSAGFVLRARDEEPQINITLLEMLRQDFGHHIGGLDPLPRDEKGIDLAGIFTTIRHVVMRMPRWDIVESALLGLFSFNRFVMWNDIRSRADDLAKNKVVASLMAGRMQWEPGESFPDPAQLDELYAPDQLPLPISADSSQITAVCAANEGKSFVLHGPPGTGKSQTITNLIATALGNGKTVLFVAEKMAALSVVQSRLEQIGLGPYCLELHSNKSTKKAVLDQLRRTLETARAASPDEWKRQADRLAAARRDLNGYVTALHRKYGFGASLHEAIVGYGRVKSAPNVASFEPAVVGRMTQEQFEAWTEWVRELRVAGEAAGHPSGNAWSDAACTVYTPAMRAQVEELLSSYAAKLAELRTAYADLAGWVEAPSAEPDPAELQRLGDVAELLCELPDTVPSGLLQAAELDTARERVAHAVQHGRLRDEARAKLATRLTAEALAMDAGLALSEWRKAGMNWFLPRYFKHNRIYKMVKGMTLPGTSLQKSDVVGTLSLIVQYQAEAAELKQAEPTAGSLLAPLWNNGEADWAAVTAVGEWTAKLHQALLRLYGEASPSKQARERLAGLLAPGREAFFARHGASLSRFLTVRQEFQQLEERLSVALKLEWAAMDDRRGEEPWLDYRERKGQLWVRHIDTLREWCSWRQVRERAVGAGLSALVAAYERGALQHADVAPAFERAWWKAAIDYILEENKELAAFSGRLFEEKIRGFQETMERFERLTRQEIAARLAANVPPLTNQAAASSEAGILLRAIRSGGRGLSLRKLFEQIPNLLNRICPCVLMSPMSVAQYLDPKYAPFDLVVFDEASQLPTSEAVGAMARGRNVIVVGDPKQLPPTTFFANAAGEEDDDAVVPEDLESILDDCLALGMPQAHLLWHYRSRHESLIAFSNRHFYENKLLTFPSPYERKSNVKWHPVEGFYDRGKTKQNRAEAEQVVAEIVRRLRDPELSRLSMGVVTFNSIQQNLIEDLLDEAFRKEPELEQLAARLHEPIFIKNLENVQGDERDVILFSIGYGPDAAGKVVLNFGPLNREGGWRRLNVAVSRARHEMHVFSALRADHLDVSRTRAHGVSALRSFLEYAEKGVSALGVDADRLDTRTEGMEAQIAEALRREGYQVELHVGASGYRMDLAIVNPAAPDTYLLAILCDGSGYRAGKTARDREVLRGQVLRQLGWQTHRVWSMDWLDNPEKEIARIVEAAQAAAAVRAERAAAAAPVVPTVPAATPEQASPTAVETAKAPTAQTVGESTDSKDTIEHIPAIPAPTHDLAQPSRSTPYQAALLPAVSFPADEFYAPDRERLVKDQIEQVIQAEGPISRSLLARRVLQAWGIARSGARIERHMDTLLASMNVKKTEWDDVDFLWPDGLEPAKFAMYRVAEQEHDRRSAEELPPEEIANAVKEVLFLQGSLPVEDLIRETVKSLGYSRTGPALDKAVRNGLQEAARRGVAELDHGKAYYRTK